MLDAFNIGNVDLHGAAEHVAERELTEVERAGIGLILPECEVARRREDITGIELASGRRYLNLAVLDAPEGHVQHAVVRQRRSDIKVSQVFHYVRSYIVELAYRIVEISLHAELGVKVFRPVLLYQSRSGREQVRSESQPVPFYLAAQCRQRRREHIERGVLAALRSLARARGVDHADVGLTHIILRHISTVIAVHRGVVAAYDYRRVLVEILLLRPLNELINLLGRTLHDVGILIAELVAALIAQIPVLEMRIRRQHRKVERCILRGQIQDLGLGELEHLGVLVAPPDLVSSRDKVVGRSIFVVEYLISSVAFEVQLPASEIRDRPAHELLVVPGIREDVSQDSRAGIERIGIGRSRVADAAVGINGDPRSLREERRHGIGRTGSDISAIKEARITRKALVLHRKLGQLGDDILLERTSRRSIRVGHLHRFAVDIDEVPLLLGESDIHGLRVNIVARDKV